jgi:hypothetical protein
MGEPKQGDIAVCSLGYLGLVTSPHPEPTEWGSAWTGVHLTTDRFGAPWSSRSPQVVGNMSDLLTDLWMGQELDNPLIEKAFEEATRR